MNDIVILVEERNCRGVWPKGIVVDLKRGRDNVIRSVIVRTSNGLYTRPVVKLAKLDVEDGKQSQEFNSVPEGSVSNS